MGELSGKVALITGAGRGLGRAFAERLAALGASVAVHGRREHGPAEFGEGTTLTDVASEIGARFGVSSLRVLADLSVPSQVDQAIAEVIQHFGRIDILVHNAGGGPALEVNDAVFIKDDDTHSIMDDNLQATILVCQRVARDMIPRRSGRIITVSSVAGLAVDPDGHQTMYAVSKAAVAKYTKMLASQLVKHNINVNCIAPGLTKTGRLMANIKNGSQYPWLRDPGARGKFVKYLENEENSIGRPGSVDEVARVVDFFAGPLGSFVTGEVLKVDGGVARL